VEANPAEMESVSRSGLGTNCQGDDAAVRIEAAGFVAVVEELGEPDEVVALVAIGRECVAGGRRANRGP
jgi:hypothetical protein